VRLREENLTVRQYVADRIWLEFGVLDSQEFEERGSGFT